MNPSLLLGILHALLTTCHHALASSLHGLLPHASHGLRHRPKRRLSRASLVVLVNARVALLGGRRALLAHVVSALSASGNGVHAAHCLVACAGRLSSLAHHAALSRPVIQALLRHVAGIVEASIHIAVGFEHFLDGISVLTVLVASKDAAVGVVEPRDLVVSVPGVGISLRSRLRGLRGRV